MTRHRIAGVPALVAVLLAAIAPVASAGPYGEGLGKCMVSATTTAEKTTLVRWMFAMMALHPDVQSSSAVTVEQRTALSKETAQLFERLLTASCEKEAREALKYEGASTLEASFSLLGQVAARELFSSPSVTAGLTEFGKYVDEKKLSALTEPQPE